MIEVTNNELIDLRDSNSLVVGEVYRLNDYNSLNIYLTATNENTLADESTTDDPNISLHYDLDSGVVDYMKDITRNIEGYFDWSSNVEGEVSDIYFENSKELKVKDSSNVFCKNEVSGSVIESSNIIIGNGSIVEITGSSFLTIGERNTLSLTEKTAISVGDDNENITFGDYSKIGSRNRNISIDGESNIVKSDNYNLEILGDFNEVESSRFVEIEGSFNDVEKTNLSKLSGAVGNKVFDSSSVDIVNVNNNFVVVRNIKIEDKPAFLEYSSSKNSDVKKVENLIERVNLQSDNEGRVLILDQQKFYDEIGNSGTKADVEYILVNGVWTEVKK